jgi:hypothetical protein
MKQPAKSNSALSNQDLKSAATRAAATRAYAAILVTFLSAMTGPAEAGVRRHLYPGDISYGPALFCGSTPTPVPLIYPDADWRPFFHRARHFGPVLYLPVPCAAAAVAPEPTRPISTLD